MSYYPPTCEESLPATAQVAPLNLGAELARLARFVNPDEANYDTATAQRVVARLIREAEGMPVVEDVECGYDDEVDDFDYHRRGDVITFTCPRCGTDREVDAPEPDPDMAYDEMRDARAEGRL